MPEARTLPIIGDTIPCLDTEKWDEYFRQRTSQLGPVFKTSVLGKDVIMICDNKIAKAYQEKYDVRSMVRVHALCSRIHDV